MVFNPNNQEGIGGSGGSAPNTDVYTMIRVDLLRVDSTALPDAVIDRAFDRMRRQIIARYPCIGDYAALSGPDALFFDEAASYMLATLLYPFKYGGQAGLLTGVAVGDFKYTYGQDKTDARDGWTDQAAQSLGMVSCIKVGRRAEASGYSLFALAGRSRQREQEWWRGALLPGLLDAYQAYRQDWT